MSESVSNNGESYSGNSSKYGRSSSRSSESPSSESHSNWGASSSPAPSKTSEDSKIAEIKKLLKEAEDYLIKYGKEHFASLSEAGIRNDFRDLVMKNEASIIEHPNPNTLVGCYQVVYNNLNNIEKEAPKNKVLMEGLHEFVNHKRQANSKLKYW
jgi:hypothetical protein